VEAANDIHEESPARCAMHGVSSKSSIHDRCSSKKVSMQQQEEGEEGEVFIVEDVVVLLTKI
jgi:hypothetical protein